MISKVIDIPHTSMNHNTSRFLITATGALSYVFLSGPRYVLKYFIFKKVIRIQCSTGIRDETGLLSFKNGSFENRSSFPSVLY